MAASNVTWPYFSKLSTKSVIKHFDDDVFNTSPSSHLYRLITALIGDSGAGDLVKQSLIARANKDIETTWFEDLDTLFSNILGFQRLPEEDYDFSPSNDILTENQINEAMIKDAWYRARVKDLLSGLQLGGTKDGFNLITRAITSVDADIYETWQYRNRGVSVGRITPTADREIVIVPHKYGITEKEKQVLLRVADRLKPADSFVTIDTVGLAVHSVLNVRNCASDSSYFEVRKQITNEVDMSDIPAPEYLADELWHGQKWLYGVQQGESAEAPEAAFAKGQEYSQYYTYDSDGSQITNADYMLLSGSSYIKEKNFSNSEHDIKYSDWIAFPIADSPDNYPGGKNGITPNSAPALNTSMAPYVFEYDSQQEFVNSLSDNILAQGGEISKNMFRIKLNMKQSLQVYLPESSISNDTPKPNILATSWYSDRNS